MKDEVISTCNSLTKSSFFFFLNRGRNESCNKQGNKACRERLRREKLNERYCHAHMNSYSLSAFKIRFCLLFSTRPSNSDIVDKAWMYFIAIYTCLVLCWFGKSYKTWSCHWYEFF